MIEKEEQQAPVKKTVAIVCDRCKRRAHKRNDIFEYQEFYRIRFFGGFGSVFGDGNKIVCDLCQHCLKQMLAGIYRITGRKR